MAVAQNLHINDMRNALFMHGGSLRLAEQEPCTIGCKVAMNHYVPGCHQPLGKTYAVQCDALK